MRGFAPFLLLLATKAGLTAGHAVKAQQHDGSRALSEVFDANEVDMFYRRLDPQPGNCCGMCTEIELSAEVVMLLVSIDGTLSYGQLNPFGLSVDITIIIRLTIEYTDNTATDTEAVVVLEFDVEVQPADWNETPCSYLDEGCKVFENDEILMFGPDAPGDFAILSLDTVNTFTDQTNVNVMSTKCDVRCKDATACDRFEGGNVDLGPDGGGTSFGAPTQSVFNAGFCPSTIFQDPHVTGLRGQRYDWSGEDGGWYAFLSTQDQLQMNLRVTSHLPETFPERQLVTGVAVVTEGGHTITVDIVDPLDLAPTCHDTANAGSTTAPCLVNGGLRVTVDGREELQGAGEYGFDGGIEITAVNLPLECQRFGDYLMWGGLDEGQKLMHAGRRLLSSTSIFDWLLKDSVMIAPPWCVKYLEELDGDVTALAGVESNHAVLRIDTPNLSLRVNVGINSEQEQTLEDGRVVPTASFWQMDVRVEHAEGMATAKGMLGETARLVHDKQTGKAVMSGLGVLRGDVEDYRVMHPLGTEFKQMFVREED